MKIEKGNLIMVNASLILHSLGEYEAHVSKGRLTIRWKGLFYLFILFFLYHFLLGSQLMTLAY